MPRLPLLLAVDLHVVTFIRNNKGGIVPTMSGGLGPANDRPLPPTPTGLADLVRTAFAAEPPVSFAAQRSARDELWRRLQPQVDSMCIRVCRRSHPSLQCAGPGQCTHHWCDTARDYLVRELFNPSRPRSLSHQIAARPEATDEDVTRWVATKGTGLWTETRRALLLSWGLQQRVDRWIDESPHRECLQTVLNSEIGGLRDLLHDLGVATAIDDWVEAFAVDAVQWADEFPDCDRVLRFLARADQEGFLEEADDRRRAELRQLVLGVEAAFRSFDEAICTECGGQPRLDEEARRALAQQSLVGLTEDQLLRLTEAGIVTMLDGTAVVVPGRAGRILLFVDPPPTALLADDERRPPWFQRFVLEPRTKFLVPGHNAENLASMADPAPGPEELAIAAVEAAEKGGGSGSPAARGGVGDD